MFAQLLLTATLAATPLAAGPGPDAPRPVRLLTVEGVPSEATANAEFMAGFDQALAASTLPIERQDPEGTWRPAGSRPSRFALLDDPGDAGAWTLQVVVRAPPPFAARRYNRSTRKSERHVNPDLRASRGMTVALLVLSPEAIAAGVRAMPDHFAFAFPQNLAPAGVLGKAPGGFRFPWRDAGRATATLALELLHERAGDLDEDVRGDLSPAVRADAVR